MRGKKANLGQWHSQVARRRILRISQEIPGAMGKLVRVRSTQPFTFDNSWKSGGVSLVRKGKQLGGGSNPTMREVV